MKVLELFAGTSSVGNEFEKQGHEVFRIEWNKDFDNIDLYEDIGNVSAEQILNKFGKPDVIWASPDCTTYSVAAISRHRRKQEDGNLSPKECWRLMGFSDTDYEAARTTLNDTFYNGNDRSGSQLYKMAGNSIVVDVLYYIFKNLLTKVESPDIFFDV